MSERLFCLPGPGEVFDVDRLLGQLSVRSPYGRKHKNNLAMHAPGDEDYLRYEFSLIAMIMEAIARKDYWVWECEGLLGKIVWADEALEAAHQGRVLSIQQIGVIMQTCMVMKEIRKLGGQLPAELEPMIAPKLSSSLQKLMGLAGLTFADGTPRLETPTGRSYRKSLEEQQRIVKAMRDEYLSLTGTIEESTGLTVTPGGTIRVSRLDESLIDYLDRTMSVQRHLESANYIIYILRKSDRWHHLVEQVKKLRLDVARYGEDCRREFSELVGKTRSELGRTLSELGHLDLLIAKARYGDGFAGLCPEIKSEPSVRLTGGKLVNNGGDSDESPRFDCCLAQGICMVADRSNGYGGDMLLTVAGLMFGVQMGVPVAARRMETGLFHFICYIQGRKINGKDRLHSVLDCFTSVTDREGRGLFLLDDPGDIFPAGFSAAFVQALLSRVRRDRDLVVVSTGDSHLAAHCGKSACYCLALADDGSIARSAPQRVSLIPWDDFSTRDILVETVDHSPIGKDIEQYLDRLWKMD